VNSSIGENRINISNFLNNQCLNLYVTVVQIKIASFLVERDADIINLNYKKKKKKKKRKFFNIKK